MSAVSLASPAPALTADTSPHFRRASERVTLVTALLGFAALAVTGEVGVGTLLFGFVLMALSAWRERVPWLPSERQWNLVNLFVLGLCLAWWHLVTHDLLPPIILFTTYLQVVRLMSPRRSRDILQIYIIAFGMLLLSSILTTTIFFLPIFLAFGASMVLGLLLLTVRREAERARPTLDPPARALNALVNRRFVRAVGAVTLGLYVMAAVFFIALPRYQGNDWFRNLRRPPRVTEESTRSGMGDSVGLGEISQIRLDPTIIMRVSLPDLESRGLPPPDHLRLRGPALGHFDGERWRHMESEGGRLEMGIPGWPLRINEGEPDLVQMVFLEAGASPYLFAQNRPLMVTLLGSQQRPVEINSWGDWARLADTDQVPEPLTYRAVSEVVDADLHRTMVESDPDQWIPLAIAPTDDPAAVGDEIVRLYYSGSRQAREFQAVYGTTEPWSQWAAPIRALAVRWAAEDGAEDPVAIANALVRHFHTEFDYTLSPRVTTPDFPVLGFLTDTRSGHCEYFATGMVLMLRSLGIPARLVTGYYTREWNSSGRFFVVRESHAHAWAEMYVPFPDRRGWLPWDPTPASGMPREITLTLWQRFNHWLDAHRYTWYRWVIDLGQTQQREIFSRLGLPRGSLRRSLALALSNLLYRTKLATPFGPAAPLLLLSALLLIVLVAALVAVLRRRGAQRRAHRLRRRANGPVTAFYLRLIRWLRRRGFVRPPGMTPAEFARVVQRTHPDWADVAVITELYYRDRYAPKPLTEDEIHRAEQLVAALTR